MADYWKSQARKFCEFCKCWIADNKPSIQYHQNGKRHKESVAKKISEMTKKSVKQQKENAKLDTEMKKMEEEAMRAYMKDIQSSADFTSRKLKQTMGGRDDDEEDEEEDEDEEEEVEKNRGKERNSGKNNETGKRLGGRKVEEMVIGEKEEDAKKKDGSREKKVWYEGKSPEGHSYYWNVDTSESVWEEPEGGYVSLEEQDRTAKTEEQKKAREEEREVKRQEATSKRQAQEKAEELRSFQVRESMKRFRKKEPEKEEEEEEGGSGVATVMGPQPRVDPYGGWVTIQPVKEEKVDLQLPQRSMKFAPVIPKERARFRIREKIVAAGSLVRSGEWDEDGVEDNKVVFKKRRKFGGNTRKRRGSDEYGSDDEDDDSED